MLQSCTLVLIILAGYLCKRCGLFGAKDYRVLQTAEFNLVLPGAIIYSFATNPHDLHLLWVSVFAVIVAAIPPICIFLTTRRTPVTRRTFLMLNGSGFNIGCFSFPVLQSLIGPAALVPAAMFDVGNSVMVAAGTNVMTQSLLHIQPGKTLAEQHASDAPTLPHQRPQDKDARRLARHGMYRTVAKGFFSSASFDTYLLMIVLMLMQVPIPSWIATICQPFSSANTLCSMLMVGLLMELPNSIDDVKAVGTVLAWRLPCSALFAAAAWFLLPFDPMVREAVAICCMAPTAVFATMFTDRVLGNAKLAGFTLSLTAVIAIMLTTMFHWLVG